MKRYEAVLEQLEQAQSRGMETFSNRLDFVVQTLEELIREAKASVQEAQPQSAEECFPISGIKAALHDYRDDAERQLEQASKLAAKTSEAEGASPPAAAGTSIELLRSLDAARSQSELLKELLPAISQHAARSVVLVLRDGRVTAWSGIGFTDGELLRQWQGASSSNPIGRSASRRPTILSWPTG